MLRELAGMSETNITDILANADQKALERLTEGVIKVHHRYWKNL